MRVALAGFGVVGQSLARLVLEHGPTWRRVHGLGVTLVAVADSRGVAVDPRGLDPAALLATRAAGASGRSVASLTPGAAGGPEDVARLLAEVEADVLVQATPTKLRDPMPAIGQLRACLSSGRHAVTVNKAPLAVAMPALLEVARYNGVLLRFSGTVGGGTPVLHWAAHTGTGAKITGVRAILNGTTNFILSKMSEEGTGFEAALSEAQGLGYAEADPSADVDGIDAGMKLVILANHAMGLRARFEDVAIEGIRGVRSADFVRARGAGRTIKLIARAGTDGLSVRPEEVEIAGPLNVGGSLNAVTLTLEVGAGATGETTLVGRGAGGPETASAIVRDLLDVWRHLARGPGAGGRAAARPPHSFAISADATAGPKVRADAGGGRERERGGSGATA